MAQFTLEQYEAQNKAGRSSSNGGDRTKVHFMGEFLKNDGDSVVVRFPYDKPTDLMFESVHKVIGVFPNNKFGKAVCCTGDDSCPLCASADADTKKRSLKFYAKFIVYGVVDGTIKMLPTVWERPSMFADSDLKGMMAEYPGFSNYLFKITRTGSGTATRYTLTPVNMANPIYSGAEYAKDLSSLKDIDPVKILTKSMQQYNEALHPELKAEITATTEATATTVTTSKPEVIKGQYNAADDPFAKKEETVVTPAATTASTEAKKPDNGTGPKRFTF